MYGLHPRACGSLPTLIKEREGLRRMARILRVAYLDAENDHARDERILAIDDLSRIRDALDDRVQRELERLVPDPIPNRPSEYEMQFRAAQLPLDEQPEFEAHSLQWAAMHARRAELMQLAERIAAQLPLDEQPSLEELLYQQRFNNLQDDEENNDITVPPTPPPEDGPPLLERVSAPARGPLPLERAPADQVPGAPVRPSADDNPHPRPRPLRPIPFPSLGGDNEYIDLTVSDNEDVDSDASTVVYTPVRPVRRRRHRRELDGLSAPRPKRACTQRTFFNPSQV